MARLTPSTILASYDSISKLNANFTAIADLFEKCLFRDGTAPNSMLADLDMNHYNLRNVADGIYRSDGVNLGQVMDIAFGTVPISSGFTAGYPTADPGSRLKVTWGIGGDSVGWLPEYEGGLFAGASEVDHSIFKVFDENSTGALNGVNATLFVGAASNGNPAVTSAFRSHAIALNSGDTVISGSFVSRTNTGVTAQLRGVSSYLIPDATGHTTSGSSGVESVLATDATSPAVGVNIYAYAGGKWQNGINISEYRDFGIKAVAGTASARSFISTQDQLFSESAIKLGKGQAQGIEFGAEGDTVSPYIFGTATRQLTMKLGSGNVFNIRDKDNNLPWQFNATNKTMQMPTTVVASLPSPSVGLRAFVTDSNTATFGDVVGGGGVSAVPVYAEGTNWRVG